MPAWSMHACRPQHTATCQPLRLSHETQAVPKRKLTPLDVITEAEAAQDLLQQQPADNFDLWGSAL